MLVSQRVRCVWFILLCVIMVFYTSTMLWAFFHPTSLVCTMFSATTGVGVPTQKTDTNTQLGQREPKIGQPKTVVDVAVGDPTRMPWWSYLGSLGFTAPYLRKKGVESFCFLGFGPPSVDMTTVLIQLRCYPSRFRQNISKTSSSPHRAPITCAQPEATRVDPFLDALHGAFTQ